MAIYLKRSTDVGAPSLTQAAGSLIALLDFLLVTTMGWTKPYTGTNKAAYRSPAGTNQFYLRVDDSAANFARIVGYEAMTDVDTGTGPFPTAAQVSGGLYLDKSTATATRAWKFISNGTMFYLFIQANGTNWFLTAFGDFTSYKSGDVYGTCIIAQTASGTASQNAATVVTALASVTAGHYIARAYTQIGSSKQFGKFTDSVRNNNSSAIGVNGMTYPSPVEGGLHLAPVWMAEGAEGIRGLLPGLWAPMHARPLTDGDTFTGVGNLSGRSFEAFDFGNGINQCFMETTDTWGDA